MLLTLYNKHPICHASPGGISFVASILSSPKAKTPHSCSHKEGDVVDVKVRKAMEDVGGQTYWRW